MSMSAKTTGSVRLRNYLLAAVFFSMATFLVGFAPAAAADGSANSGDDAAIKDVVAAFSNGWNTHDAHAMCVSLADDVAWVNWRGEPLGTRKAVEEEHAMLFAELYKNTHRTDEVKSIKYVSPNLA